MQMSPFANRHGSGNKSQLTIKTPKPFAKRPDGIIESTMRPYSLYVIDGSGRVVDLYEVECGSDEEAYHKASTVVGSASIDIWQDDRWIAWLDGKDPHRVDLMHHVVVA
jgi:hypothetical protein